MILTIVVTGYKFLFGLEYEFYVEAPCDPSSQTCFVRDCSEPESCPPNELESYRAFYLSAEDFNTCRNNSCLYSCTNGIIECQEVLCGESEGDECSHPQEEKATGSEAVEEAIEEPSFE